MLSVVLTASPHWWVTGWVLSIGMLVVGFGIGILYYDTEEEAR